MKKIVYIAILFIVSLFAGDVESITACREIITEDDQKYP